MCTNGLIVKYQVYAGRLMKPRTNVEPCAKIDWWTHYCNMSVILKLDTILKEVKLQIEQICTTFWP